MLFDTHPNHDQFIVSLHARRRVRLRFRSDEDGGALLERECAPMDFGPSRRSRDGRNRYHFWDFQSESPTGAHPLSLHAANIVSIEATSVTFDPEEFVTWSVEKSPWHIPRDWGRFS